MNTTEITLPLVHLNGTGETTLRREYAKLYLALSKAEDALDELTFHPRDYYPLGVEAFAQAVEERREMDMSLTRFRQYIRRHVYALNKGKAPIPERESSKR